MIDIREHTATLLKRDLDIPSEVTGTLFDLGLIDERNAIRVLIKDEYIGYLVGNRSKTNIRIYLAERYCLSYSTIEKITAEVNGNPQEN